MNANLDLDEKKRPELTVRGLIVGVIITLVFTAANVYFGLKAGLTFSTSIPAAVISMAILRSFKNATVQENNIVQTVASAAGTLSSIIFVLPGLIMIGWWTDVSVLDLVLDLRPRRHSRRDVFHSAPPRPGHELRPAVSGRRRLRRNAQSRQRRQGERVRSRTGPRRSARGAMGINRIRRVCLYRRDANVRRGCRANSSDRPARLGDRLRFQSFLRALWCRSSGRFVGRYCHARWRVHRLGLGRAALLTTGDGLDSFRGCAAKNKSI